MSTLRQVRQQKRAFLEAFARCGNVTTAARIAEVTRTNVYRWQEHDAEFLAAFHEAEAQSTEVLEEEAQRRAMESSDTLLIFLLKARAPEKYRDTVTQRHVGASGGPVEFVTVAPSEAPA